MWVGRNSFSLCRGNTAAFSLALASCNLIRDNIHLFIFSLVFFVIYIYIFVLFRFSLCTVITRPPFRPNKISHVMNPEVLPAISFSHSKSFFLFPVDGRNLSTRAWRGHKNRCTRRLCTSGKWKYNADSFTFHYLPRTDYNSWENNEDETVFHSTVSLYKWNYDRYNPTFFWQDRRRK